MSIIKKICLISVILLMCLTIKSYANELSLEHPERINPAEQNTVEITLKGNFTTLTNSVKVRYKFSEGIELESFVPNENWEIKDGGFSKEKGLIVNTVDDSDVSGEVELGVFTLNVPSTYNKKTLTVKLYDLDATNTNMAIIDFDPETVLKRITNVIGVEDEPVEEDEPSNNEEQTNNNNTEENQQGSGSDKSESNSSSNTNTAKNSAKGKDSTVSESKFGQFGEKSFAFVIVILIAVTVVLFKKFNNLRKHIK